MACGFPPPPPLTLDCSGVPVLDCDGKLTVGCSTGLGFRLRFAYCMNIEGDPSGKCGDPGWTTGADDNIVFTNSCGVFSLGNDGVDLLWDITDKIDNAGMNTVDMWDYYNVRFYVAPFTIESFIWGNSTSYRTASTIAVLASQPLVPVSPSNEPPNIFATLTVDLTPP
jgi:hypothetical protein